MSKEKKNIVLIGGGGHCKSCIEVIESTEQYNIIGILDFPSELGKKVLNYEVIGNDEDYEKFKNEGCSFLITAGQIKSAELRKKIFEKLKLVNAETETVIAKSAVVSKYAKIGKGSIIMHNCLINAGAEICENCIINSAAIIEHDSKIGNHVHVSTNAVVNGDCTIGDESFIGSAACIANGIEISAGTVIGAGSLVIKNIKKPGIYAGNPVNEINK